MKKLSVLIPYRRRLENLRILAENLRYVDKTNIDFHLISLDDNNNDVKIICAESGLQFHNLTTATFSIGFAHNYGARIANSEYILKQDVDCIPYEGLYEKILTYLTRLKDDIMNWANLGVYYCNREFSNNCLIGKITFELYERVKENDNLKMEIKNACGNNFLVHREHFLNIGGCSDKFKGWGWEDYQVLYFLTKFQNRSFNLTGYSVDTITQKCRDEIARPKNGPTNLLDIVFLHRWHDPKLNDGDYMSFVEVNRSHLFNLINDLNNSLNDDQN